MHQATLPQGQALLNKNGKQKAKWGSLTAEFTKELERW